MSSVTLLNPTTNKPFDKKRYLGVIISLLLPGIIFGFALLVFASKTHMLVKAMQDGVIFVVTLALFELVYWLVANIVWDMYDLIFCENNGLVLQVRVPLEPINDPITMQPVELDDHASEFTLIAFLLGGALLCPFVTTALAWLLISMLN